MAVGAIGLLSTSAAAQTTSTTSAPRKFEVISVVGNQLVVRGPDGTKEYTVPEDFRFNVDGKSLSVHDLKPGMTGTATTTTLTTSKTVQVVEERNVKVMQAFGNSVILRSADGKFKLFTQEDADKYKVKITVGGKPIEFQQLRANDILSATFVTEKVVTMTEQQVNASLAKNPPPAAAAPAPKPAAATPPKAAEPVAKPAAPASAPAATGPAPKKTLPKTASQLPLLGLTGGVLLLIGVSLTIARRRRAA